ncbi:uncharacterized protein KY384_008485 [Bacidia gigantensis]|uniref:uncharacterized protein n=1 Tax=Bacidia gigantensis TaxID=2732470 RepID=UPI001D04D703|nr:uncharacterized protein KY384_008485 [Bacidia gigantensis]KAG8527056.1 hypothetical protein KY384_008485 [Bacidia gigantensis]
MPQKGPSPPTGSRSRHSAGLATSRQNNRGGIQKRGAAPRVDKDGDLAMSGGDSAPRPPRAGKSGRGITGQISRQNTPESLNNRVSSKPAKTGIDPEAIQKAVLKQLGSKAPLPKASRVRPSAKRTFDNPREGRPPLQQIKVWGLKQSKAAVNPDGGINDLIAFIERKASNPDAPAREAVKIKKSRMEDDTLIVSLRSEDVTKVLRINNFLFAGANLRIEIVPELDGSSGKNDETETPQTVDVLRDFLSRRYNAESKLLDLSQMGSDEKLQSIGMFNTTSRESKFFPALMKISDSFFTSNKDKEDAVVSVSLAGNALVDLTAVSALSQTFPTIKNLDLSNNQLPSLKALDAWRWKFRKLDYLLLSGNPIEQTEPNLQEDLLKWYPSLTIFNDDVVRSHQEVRARDSSKLPLATLGPNFRDEASIGENFVRQFFPLYDSDRTTLANGYYDSQSAFSLSVNTSAPRDPNKDAAQQVASWEHYIKRSRNLDRISHVSGKTSRLYTGSQSVCECFNSLPRTKHPDLLTEPQKWCIECHAIPGLPDISGQSPRGVGGLIVVIHGEFVEHELPPGQPKIIRSFDRTFILGPGSGIGGLRVVSDTFVLRAYGGHEAWRPEESESLQQGTMSSAGTGVQRTIGPGEARVPNGGKSAEQVQKETLAVELSRSTGMTLKYSALCLEQSGWNLEGAGVTFGQAKANLPAEAFNKA